MDAQIGSDESPSTSLAPSAVQLRECVQAAMATFLGLIVVDGFFYAIASVSHKDAHIFLDYLSFGAAACGAVLAGGTFYLKVDIFKPGKHPPSSESHPASADEQFFYKLAAVALLVSHFSYLLAHDEQWRFFVCSLLFLIFAAGAFTLIYRHHHKKWVRPFLLVSAAALFLLVLIWVFSHWQELLCG